MLYKNAYIFTVGSGFRHGSFRTGNGIFTEILDSVPEADGVDLGGAFVIPGLVETHIHGAAGADFSDGDEEGLKRMARYLAKNGITSFAPASMTLPYEQLSKAFAVGKKLHDEPLADGARLMGIHMEGPYFSEKKKGAQNSAYLKDPDIEGFMRLYEDCGGLIRIADVAAELPGAEAFAEAVSGYCTVSVAHTDADYETACRVFDAGASHLTHLFNAMPPLLHRTPGVIGAAAERRVTAELICDGYHVHPSTVRAAFKLFPGRIALISDAFCGLGMPEGEYELGGQKVVLKDHVARLADGSGTIAGAASHLYQDMLNAIRFGIPKEQAVEAATIIPAGEIGADEKVGSIENGKYADFVVCDPELAIRQVYLSGRQIA